MRDFLEYLEEKNIINGQQLEDRNEVHNLIKDLMKLDLSKFHNLRKNAEKKKRKTGSRNVNVSVNRSSSLNPQSSRQSSNYDSNGRKTHSVTSKNIYKVCGSVNQNQENEDFKSSRKLSYLGDSENKSNCYQVLRGSSQTPKGYESVPKGISPNSNKFQTPIHDSHNYHSNRFEIANRGKTAPSSSHGSKERFKPSENPQLSRQKLSSQSNANILAQNLPEDPQPKTGLINMATGLPKRSESQKLRGNSQHFMKRKECVVVENQEEEIALVLQKKLEEDNRTSSREEAKKEPASAPVKQHQNSMDAEQTCELVEPGLDKVTFNIKLKDDILSERDKMIKAIKIYIRKNKRLPPTTLDYYKFVKLVGKGAFGKVTLGIHKLTGKQVAIKTIEKSYMKDDFSRKKVLQEVYILKNIKHSNVIRLLEVFESPKHLLIVMEYSGGGDLLKYIKKHGRMDEQKAREYFIQVVYGLAHCHCRSVLHRDVKLDNILLDGEGSVKLCDFGVSKIVKKDQEINEQ